MGQPGGIGAAAAYGADAVNQLRDAIMQRLLAQNRINVSNREMDLRESEAQQRGQYQNEMLKQLAEERAAAAESRRVAAGNQVSTDLNIGDALQPDQSAILRSAHM